MRPNHHKSIALKHPNTVAPITDLRTLAQILSIPLEASCDVVEFRLDGLCGHLDEVVSTLSSIPLPCIATARHPDEGGTGNLTAKTRMEMLRACLPDATVLDIEIRTLPDAADLINAAVESGTIILGSFHDFEKTPSLLEMSQQAQRALDLGATALKFATRLHSSKDLFQLINLLETHISNVPTSVMGMGPLGQVSRLLAAQCGSFLNYGYLLEPNAPGQWPASELKQLITRSSGQTSA